MSWYKMAQIDFQRWQPINFINPLTGTISSGVFDTVMNSGKARVRIGNMTGRVVVVPLEEIEAIDDNIELQPGQVVKLVNYPTESPAEIIKKLDNGKYLISTQSKRQMELPINEITV